MLRWMLSALAFSALVALAAFFADVALRAARRPARFAWLAAAAAMVTWPVASPVVRAWFEDPRVALTVATGGPRMVVARDAIVATAASWLAPVNRLLLPFWALATALLLLRVAFSLAALRRMRSSATSSIVDGVAVLVHEHAGPAAIGVWRSRVLIPAALTELDEPLRRLAIQHEVEHCRARDNLAVLGVALANALMPWNVPLWWIGRRTRLAIEMDCDARVVAMCATPAQYGKLLLLVSQWRATPALAPMFAGSTPHLERRIAAMLPMRTHHRARLAAAVVACVVALAMACTSRITDVATAPKPALEERAVAGEEQGKLSEVLGMPMATQVAGTGRLRYPDSLRTANVEGVVTAVFIVDANGEVLPGSVKIPASSHDLFTRSVLDALPNMRFVAAELNGRKVRQVQQQAFTFSLSRSGKSPETPALLPMPKAGTERVIALPSTRGPSQIPGTGNIRYPDSLRTAEISGEVRAQFVVDAEGHALQETFKVLSATHKLFAEAVRNALPNMRFNPAMIAGSPVSQLTDQSFTFKLSR